MTDTTGIRYGPHIAALSAGYVLFSYAAVPEAVTQEFGVGFTAVGLLMSASLVSFVAVQVIGGRLINDRPTVPVLVLVVTMNALVAIGLDFITSFRVLLVGRAVWGLTGGLVVTLCATHISRIHDGPTATCTRVSTAGCLRSAARRRLS